MIIVLQAGFKLDQILLEKQQQIFLVMPFQYLQMEVALPSVQTEMIEEMEMEMMEGMHVFMNMMVQIGTN